MVLTEEMIDTLAQEENYSSVFEEFVKNLPKVELHVHLDGSFDPYFLYDYLLLNDANLECLPVNTTLPWDGSDWPVRHVVSSCKTPRDFHALCECRGKQSLKEMIKCFEIFTPIVKGNLKLIEDLAFDFCKRQAQQSIIYTEVRYSPHVLAKDESLTGISPADADSVVDAVTKGLRRGQDQYGIIVNQILCCICWRPEWAHDVVRLANERRDVVVGVDIAAGEEHFDAKAHPDLHGPHNKAMMHAQELNLNVTMHAGEVGGSENVRIAVWDYGAKRIGHGYQIIGDTKLMNDLRERDIHIEVCPISSRETGGWSGPYHDWENHPGSTMVANNLSVGLNSDDPAVFNTSLAWQLRIGLAKMKLSKEEIVRSVQESIRAAFCSEATKESLRSKLDSYLQKGVLSYSRGVEFDERVGGNEERLDNGRIA